MRVLHTVARLSVGGINSLLLQTISSLPDLEHHVAYLTANDTRENEYRTLGIQPHGLKHGGTKDGLSTLKKATDLIRTLKPDVVHVNHALDAFYLGMAARRCRVPVVATLHATAVPSRKRKLLMAPLSHMATRFIAVSQTVKDASCEYFGLSPDKVDVVYSGIDTQAYGPSDPHVRRELAIDATDPVLINVGRLHPIKNQISLIPLAECVAKKHPRTRLVVVGQGEEWNRLRGARDRSPVRGNIHLLGRRSDVRDLLQTADIYVSMTSSEGFSIATIEAMAAGLPIVATDIRPTREAVPAEAGVLVPVGDVEAAADAVIELLNNAQRRGAMGRQARKVAVDKFDVRMTASTLRAVYAGVAR